MKNLPYELAKKEIGTLEWQDGDNPKVVQYFKDAGAGWVHDDETAWCAAFVGAMLERGGLPGTRKMNARSYLDWGEPVPLEEAVEGDIVVFKRGNSTWRGHVAFFVQNYGDTLAVLGGNQSNSVSVARYKTRALLGVRRAPQWDRAAIVDEQPIVTDWSKWENKKWDFA